MKRFLLKLFGAKKRNEIRHGKLWEITKIWGLDLFKTEVEPAKPEPLVRREETAAVDKMQVHVLKKHDDVTNLTKKPDVL